jgi:pyrrolysine biosynthesis protein PylC
VRVAVIGGGLQGVEAAYLAHKAGWEVRLIDREPNVPASGLSDSFIQLDVTQIEQLDTIFRDIDLVIPATEDAQALGSLVQWSRSAGVPLAFDALAYEISSAKLESHRLFDRLGLPGPKTWPGCGFPLLVKPNRGSGSQGVELIHHQQQLEQRFPSFPPQDWVVQEYLEGPSYSLEVVGKPGHYQTLRVTDLEMDAGYDCKRVVAPTCLSPHWVIELEQMSLKIAEALQLKGLMDVETILHNDRLILLEIDARLPSQTPTAVYWSSGINMLELLAHCFLPIYSESSAAKNNPGQETSPLSQSGVVYEHIEVGAEAIEVCGEHIMTAGGPLRRQVDFFGADEAITNYTPGRSPWIATLINRGKSLSQAWEKRNRVIENLRQHFKLDFYRDPEPVIPRDEG